MLVGGPRFGIEAHFFLFVFLFLALAPVKKGRMGRNEGWMKLEGGKEERNYEPCVCRCEGLRPPPPPPHFLSLATLQELPQDPQYLSFQELVCEPCVCKWRGPSVFWPCSPAGIAARPLLLFLELHDYFWSCWYHLCSLITIYYESLLSCFDY